MPKHCIRDNANTFILFHQDDKTMKYFHENISGDMNFLEFKKFYDAAWCKKHGCITIINGKTLIAVDIFQILMIYMFQKNT